MRKTATQKRVTAAKNSRMRKAPSRKKAARGGMETALKKVNAIKKIMRAKFKVLKTEFQKKLKLLTDLAYEKAHAHATREHEKKAKAKSKMMAAAEAKFEKKYAKKAKKVKSKSKKRPTKMARPSKKQGRRQTKRVSAS